MKCSLPIMFATGGGAIGACVGFGTAALTVKTTCALLAAATFVLHHVARSSDPFNAAEDAFTTCAMGVMTVSVISHAAIFALFGCVAGVFAQRHSGLPRA